MEFVTAQQIIDLLPIVAERDWRLRDGAIRDSDNFCPVCALVQEIDPSSPYKLFAWQALDRIGVTGNAAYDLMEAADEGDGGIMGVICRRKILEALKLAGDG